MGKSKKQNLEQRLKEINQDIDTFCSGELSLFKVLMYECLMDDRKNVVNQLEKLKEI